MISGGPKIAVVGVGYVGGTYAFDLMMSGLAREIVLIDKNHEKAESQAMDLNHGLSFTRPGDIHAGEFEDCAGSVLVVVTAGAAQKPGQSRLDLVGENVKIFDKIIPEIAEHAPETILLIVTNPVDVLTWTALKLSGFPPERVMGSGTVLDTARLRYMIGHRCRVDVRNVHAHIIGEHGDSELPVWSRANIGGMSLAEYCPLCGRGCDYREELKEIFEDVRTSAYKIVAAKGATAYAVARALVRITEAVVRDENSVLPVSSLIKDYCGVDDVCLGCPAVVNAGGVDMLLKLPLDEEEQRMFRDSAATVRGVIDKARVGA
jgi:L-lactate dehydrogenase